MSTGQAGMVLKPLIRLGDKPTDCWQWIGNVATNGYGQKDMAGRTHLAHRWLWQQLFGPVPYGMVINHKCSNKLCVNPFHLEVVTQQANVRHGARCLLNEQDVDEIRAASHDEDTKNQLAARFGISPYTVKGIWAGRNWRKPKSFHGRTKKGELLDQ